MNIILVDTDVAKCNLGKVKLQANMVNGLILKRTWSVGWLQGPFAYLVTYVASLAGIFELIFADLLFKLIFADSSSQPFPPPFFLGGGGGVWVSIGSGEYFKQNSFRVTVPVGGCMQEGGGSRW